MYICNTYHVSIGSNGFWILRVTIYSRIHKSYAPPPLLLSPSSSCRADSLFLYLRPGKLRWWWVFTHPLNYTLSAQLKNPGGPPSADLQNLRSSKKPSNRIERKIRFLLSLPRFQLFMLSHTYRNFCSFFWSLKTVFENHWKKVYFCGFQLIFKRSFVSSNQCQTALIFSIQRAHFKAIL